MSASSRRAARALSLLALLVAVGCTERPTEPRRVARRPVMELNQYGEMPLVVGSTVRGIALLQVGLANEEKPRWEFRNETPDDAEAWGGIALAPGEKYELTLRGYDINGKERFAGSLVVPVEEGAVPQVRAEAKFEGETPDPGVPEVYAGSYGLGSSPRWVTLGTDDITITVWAHDALGERLDLAPEDLSVFLDPRIGSIEVGYGDRELRELVLKMHPYYTKEPPPDPPTVTFCVYGDVSCTTMYMAKPPEPPASSIYLKVVADQKHTCALRGDFLARCWGDDGDGVQAGTSTNNLAGHWFMDIDTNEGHSCGVETTGVASCWGSNDWGQLGSGNPGLPPISSPQPVNTTRRFQRIATGKHHSCAIDQAGAVWCWGANDAGQLGDGMGGSYTQASIVPRQAMLSTGAAVAIDAGDYHTCALTAVGALECWGLNDNGQVGVSISTRNGCLVFSSTAGSPCVRAPAIVAFNLAVSTFSAGGRQTCAVDTAGALRCWGSSFLGDGSTTSGPTRVQVAPGQTFRGVAVGGGHACGITSAGAGLCWGTNGSGELGSGGVTGKELSPVGVVSPPSAYRAMGLGAFHSCGIRSDRTALFCWGAGGSALGFSPTSVSEPAPKQVTVF